MFGTRMPETIPAKLKMSTETWRGQYLSLWTTVKSLLMGTQLKKKWPDCFVSSWNYTRRSRGSKSEFNCCILWSNIFRYTAKHQQSVQDFLRKAEMEWNWRLQILNHNSYKRLKIKRNICSKFWVSSGAALIDCWGAVKIFVDFCVLRTHWRAMHPKKETGQLKLWRGQEIFDWLKTKGSNVLSKFINHCIIYKDILN